MSELRKDPIVDRWVVVAENRSQRPGAFLADPAKPPAQAEPAASALPAATNCPFCVGNEIQTPPAVYERCDARGQWTVRIIPNKYPAVTPLEENPNGMPNFSPAVGVHEVVVESAEHAMDLVQLADEQLLCVVTAWRDRLGEHRRRGQWPFAWLFKNVGREAGASVEHVHSQIVALPRVPTLVHEELNAAAALHKQHGQCAFCRFIAEEREAASRIVIDQGSILAIAAFAGRQPYEMWILPAEHQAAYDAESDRCLAHLASALAQLLRALRHVLSVPAYNLILHTAPFDTYWGDRYHWHIEIIPRVCGLAGFELGSGEFINPVSPERAAREIKRILSESDEL